MKLEELTAKFIIKTSLKDFENIYEIWSDGKILSLKRPNVKKDRFMTPCVSGNGYKIVTLSKNGIKYKVYLHRLLAETFIPNPMNFEEINHKDGNKINNSLENLEWCTHKDNMQHAIQKELWNHKNSRKFSSEQIKYIRKMVIEKKLTQKKLAELFNVTDSCINLIVKGKRYNVA